MEYKIKVIGPLWAHHMLEFHNIPSTVAKGAVYVSECNATLAESLLKELKPLKPKPAKSKPPGKRGPKTKASRGEERYTAYSITVSPEANKHLLDCKRDSETVSSAVDRLLLEHKTYSDLEEMQ